MVRGILRHMFYGVCRLIYEPILKLKWSISVQINDFNALSVHFGAQKFRNFYPSLSLRKYILSQIKLLFCKNDYFESNANWMLASMLEHFPFFIL